MLWLLYHLPAQKPLPVVAFIISNVTRLGTFWKFSGTDVLKRMQKCGDFWAISKNIAFK